MSTALSSTIPGFSVFCVIAAAVAAPMLAEIRIGLRVPVVVLEVLLGIVIGPYVLDLVRHAGFVENMFGIAMAATLFMAGMELEFEQIRGRPLNLALGGWIVSVLLGLCVVGLLHVVPTSMRP